MRELFKVAGLVSSSSCLSIKQPRMKEREHPTFSTTLHSEQGRWGRAVSAAQATSQGVTRGGRRAGEEGPSQGRELWPVRSASWALAQTQSRKTHREDCRPETSPPSSHLDMAQAAPRHQLHLFVKQRGTLSSEWLANTGHAQEYASALGEG